MIARSPLCGLRGYPGTWSPARPSPARNSLAPPPARCPSRRRASRRFRRDPRQHRVSRQPRGPRGRARRSSFARAACLLRRAKVTRPFDDVKISHSGDRGENRPKPSRQRTVSPLERAPTGAMVRRRNVHVGDPRRPGWMSPGSPEAGAAPAGPPSPSGGRPRARHQQPQIRADPAGRARVT
jgi:hypothetical protein